MAKLKAYVKGGPIREVEVDSCLDADDAGPAQAADPWLEDLLAQKRHISQLQEKLDLLREEVKECRQELQAAEARLFTIIEEAGQKHLPLQ